MKKYPEIDEAIAYMRRNLYEPISLARLAGHVGYSPFHFIRIFKERTGLSPHYYVSSLRLQKAKDLLLHTNLSVRDVGQTIGQQSLGTFTTRFTERVGLTPAQFRSQAQVADGLVRTLQEMEAWPDVDSPSLRQDWVEGEIQSDIPFEGVTLVGLFAKPIPEGMPLYGTVLSSLGPFGFTRVKPGVYYLMATSVSWEMKAMDIMLPHATLRARAREPVVVAPGKGVPYQRLHLHPPRADDPPILISLPLLMNRFLSRIDNQMNRK